MYLSYMAIVAHFLLDSTIAGDVLELPPPGHFVVKLHRQRVPVEGQSDTVSYKNVYFGTVFIGSPSRQEFSVVFDTGSGHVVVPSTSCTSTTCRVHRRYSRKDSHDAKDVDYDGAPVQPGTPRDQLTIAFGTGEVTGQFVNDRLCLSDATLATEGADAALDSISPRRVRLDMSTEVASSAQDSVQDKDCILLRVVTATEMTHEPFHAFSFDGILGLGLDALTLAPEFSFFGQMVAQGKVANPTFAVFLADAEEEESEICFGGYLQERLQTDLLWSPVALPELGYWQVQIHRIRIGNKSLSFCDDGQCRAVVDTGTSLLAVPRDFSDELEEELIANLHDPPTTGTANSLGQAIDCKLVDGALLHFDIEGLTVSLTAGDYARPAVMLSDESRKEVQEVTSSVDVEHRTQNSTGAEVRQDAKCQPTIMPLDMPAPIGPKLFIWGEPVLRQYYTVYDWQNRRIGFGKSVHITDEDLPDSEASDPESVVV